MSVCPHPAISRVGARMILGRRFAIRPTNAQRTALAKAAGCSRWAWNWGLAKKIEAYKLRKLAIDSGVMPADAPKVPTAIDLHRDLNALKDAAQEAGGVPWMRESTKCAPQEALRSLDVAYAAFFRRVKAGERPGFPRFHGKRPGEGHFAVTGAIAVGPCTVTLPRIGAVRIMPGDRGYAPTMRYVAASVVQEHGEWFVSVRVEAADAEPAPEDAPRVGLDIGVRKLAVLSDGTVFTNPKALRRAELRLKRAQRVLSRRVRGSGRRRDARKRLAARHQRVANVRRDALHKATTMIARMHPVVVVEDLKVRGMTRRAHGKGRAVKAGLNRSTLDASFGEFRRMLAYKLAMRGGRLIAVHAAYTSQTCSACQSRTNCGSNETFTCAACGFTVDRDLNAAINIRARSYGPNDAASWPESPPSGGNARGGAVRHRERKLAVLAPMKRELERDHV